jgi:hypothetical protein
MKEVIFTADYFTEDYKGGAELTTQAIMSQRPEEIRTYRVHTSKITQEFIEKHKDKHWVVCNFASLDDTIKVYMCKNINYSIVEYDYKFCKYRSLEKHKTATNSDCDCIQTFEGRVNSAFYGYAQRIWFMSEKQKNIFLDNVKTIKKEKVHVLSSVFEKADLKYMDLLKDNEKNDKYLILKSGSWIKGTNDCIEYAKKNNLKYELIEGLPYHELLIKMSLSKGLIFMPLGGDTCPRIVIEAKMLGCDIILNDYVQHKDETWFSGTQVTCYEYLKERTNIFWSYYE